MAFCSKIITGWTAPAICLSLASKTSKYSDFTVYSVFSRRKPSKSAQFYLTKTFPTFGVPIIPVHSGTIGMPNQRLTILHIYSHLANQRMDGIFGGIIISEPDSPPGIPLVMFDWFQTNSLDLVTSNPFDQGIGMVSSSQNR